MSIIEFLFQTNVMPYTIGLFFLCGLLFIEMVAILSFGTSSLFFADGWLDGLHIDSGGGTMAETFLGWLNWGKVPFIVLFTVFLTSFIVTGYILQYIMLSLFSFMLPTIISIIPVLIISFFTVHYIGIPLANLFPNIQTSAIKIESLVGFSGVVVLGTMKRNKAAEIKVLDPHGQTHYMMAEPTLDDAVIQAGEQVIVDRFEGYKCFVSKQQ